jgi:hypothetical protein
MEAQEIKLPALLLDHLLQVIKASHSLAVGARLSLVEKVLKAGLSIYIDPHDLA